MSGFTPGPWKVIFASHINDVVTDDENQKVIAQVGWGEANARLIAATPNLHRAAVIALPILEQYLDEAGGCDHDVGLCVCDIKGAIESTRTAIAEAEGTAS